MKFKLFHHSNGDSPKKEQIEERAAPQGTSLPTPAVSIAGKLGDSDAIIAKVDEAYKEFTDFQTNLKQLLKVCKEEHVALRNLNEKRFEAAKALDLMYAVSPLSCAVAKGSPSAPAATEYFRGSLLNIVGEGESTNDKPTGFTTRDSSGDNNPFEDEIEITTEAKEEEQSASLRTVPDDSKDDPPADVNIPEDYPKDGDATVGLSAIVDNEDDVPADEDTARGSSHPDASVEPSGDKEVGASVHDFTDEKTGSEVNVEPAGDKHAERAESVSFSDSKGAESKATDEEEEEDPDVKDPSEDDPDEEAVAEPEIVVEDEDDKPIVKEEAAAVVQAVPAVATEIEYFKSHSPTPTHWNGARKSYYDVHEYAYRETKLYVDQHENLVKYIEDWERVLFQRVHSLYTEYMKHRTDLQHYIKKMGQLKKEMDKLQKAHEDKDKNISPKKVDKLDRNENKLTGARATHDSSGELLYLFLDEIVHRSWRDVFPYLQRVTKFDQDFAANQAELFVRLAGTSELIDLVGKNQAINITSRLESLKMLSPEVLYTGEAAKTV